MDELVIVTPMGLEGRAVRRHLSRAGNVVSGMGAIRAANAGRAIADSGPVAMAVAGFAGGLCAGQRPGQVVVASELSTSDDDASSVALPSAAGDRRPALPRRLRRDRRTGRVDHASWRGVIAGGSSPPTGAVAVDMESAWLAGPLLAIAPHRVAVVRVLSDTPDHELIRPTMGRSLRTAYRTLRAVAPVVETWAAAVAPRTAVLASPRSFCAGVERAITIVRRALEQYGPPVYVRRQIIHNTHVVAELTAAGAVFVAELDEVPRGAVTVLAAHGVAPAVREQAAARDLVLIDATCPLVAKVHTEARARARRRLLDRAHRPRRPRGDRRDPGRGARAHPGDLDAPTRSTRSRFATPTGSPTSPRPRSPSTRPRPSSPPSRSASPRSSAHAPTTSATPRRTARSRCAPSPPNPTWCSSSARRTRRTPTAWWRSPAARASPPTSWRTRPRSTCRGSPPLAPSGSPPAPRRPTISSTAWSTVLPASVPTTVVERNGHHEDVHFSLPPEVR